MNFLICTLYFFVFLNFGELKIYVYLPPLKVGLKSFKKIS